MSDILDVARRMVYTKKMIDQKWLLVLRKHGIDV